jgi:hypothetical protein
MAQAQKFSNANFNIPLPELAGNYIYLFHVLFNVAVSSSAQLTLAHIQHPVTFV